MNSNNEDDADKQNKQYCCDACGEDLDADHLGIRCQQSHYLCQDCSKTYVKNILSQPEAKIPPKCAFCNCELS